MKNLCMILLLALILCFTVGCQDKEALAELAAMKAQAAVEEQNKEVVKRYWNGKWNERRPEILDETQTIDVVYHGTSMEMKNLEEYKQVYNGFLSAFEDPALYRYSSAVFLSYVGNRYCLVRVFAFSFRS